MGTKIQINSLDALERLLGGDSEFEIEVRQSVAEAFAKRYIKSALDHEAVGALVKAEANTIREDFLDTYGPNWNSKDRLKPAYCKGLETQIQYKVQEIIGDKIDNILDEKGYYKNLNAMIAERAEYLANQWTSSRIEEMIQRRAEAIIKERLGVK